jgi:preprotein translocase subunit Sec61beta
MEWAPVARIILRYLAGGMILGSDTVGETLAADPDLVMVVGLIIGSIVELLYAYAKRKNWTT